MRRFSKSYAYYKNKTAHASIRQSFNELYYIIMFESKLEKENFDIEFLSSPDEKGHHHLFCAIIRYRPQHWEWRLNLGHAEALLLFAQGVKLIPGQLEILGMPFTSPEERDENINFVLQFLQNALVRTTPTPRINLEDYKTTKVTPFRPEVRPPMKGFVTTDYRMVIRRLMNELELIKLHNIDDPSQADKKIRELGDLLTEVYTMTAIYKHIIRRKWMSYIQRGPLTSDGLETFFQSHYIDSDTIIQAKQDFEDVIVSAFSVEDRVTCSVV